MNKRALEEQESVRWVDGYRCVDELTYVADREAAERVQLTGRQGSRPNSGEAPRPFVPNSTQTRHGRYIH